MSQERGALGARVHRVSSWAVRVTGFVFSATASATHGAWAVPKLSRRIPVASREKAGDDQRLLQAYIPQPRRPGTAIAPGNGILEKIRRGGRRAPSPTTTSTITRPPSVDQRQLPVRVRVRAAREVRDGVRGARPEEPLVGQEAADAHRPARVDAPGGDAQLGPQAEAEAVREPAQS